MKTIALTDGGLMLYAPNFLDEQTASKYFEVLRRQLAWEQKPGLFGHPQPRLISSYGDPGISYRYSGITNLALPWTQELLELKTSVESVMGSYNFCLANLYRSGKDSMGWHADNEPEMGQTIGSISLGATRVFRIRHNVTKETMNVDAGHGTLIIMSGTMQEHWQHQVPKTTKAVGERINLTFRQINPLAG